MNLRIPGPVAIPDEIRAAQSKQMIDHRGPEFAAIQTRVAATLKRVFNTTGDVLLFTSSGTGGLEAAVVNTISPGDHVLAFSGGSFGDRFADIAQAYGARVTKVDFEWGQAIDPARVAQAARENRDARVVLVTHNETSTGILHPIREIVKAVRENSDALVIVDAISALGAAEMQADAWGVDIVVTGSQKAWACPPGLAMLSISPRAWKASESAKSPRYYFDFKEMKKWMVKGQTPFTPAVSVYYALDKSLALMEAEGFANVVARHARIAQYTRAQARAVGLTLFGDARHASPSVTPLVPPNGIDAEELRRVAREEFGLVVAGGQERMKGKIVRIGHLGWVTEKEIDRAVKSLREAIEKMRE